MQNPQVSGYPVPAAGARDRHPPLGRPYKERLSSYKIAREFFCRGFLTVLTLVWLLVNCRIWTAAQGRFGRGEEGASRSQAGIELRG